jgi:FkbM family methyltransferase
MVFAPQGYDALASAIFWHGLGKAEPDACVFHRLARRATVICDVGAHLGIYALLASDANPASIVIALEPLPRVFARLALNIEANRMENVLCLPVAAGDADAIQDFFYVPMTALQSSSGLDRAFFSSGPNAEELEALPVAVARVDTLVGAIGEIADGRLDLIKIDTEGTEPSVLRGMGSILGNCRPQILCEVLPHTGTGPMIEEILAPHGYRFFHLTPDGPIERDTPIGDPSRVSRNYLCIATDVERALADARQVYFGGAPSWEGKIT